MNGASAHRFSTCYIAAPRDTDTSALRSALERRGIAWSDVFALEPSGPTLLDSIERAVLGAGFVCALVPSGDTDGLYFELGLAFAHRRPILLFIDPEARVPLDLQGLVAVRVNFGDSRSLDLPLDLFLQNAGDRLVRLNGYRTPRLKPIDIAEVRRALETLDVSTSPDGNGFDRLVARLFEQAGAIVSMPGTAVERGVDMAIGVSELQSSIGNPILVEAKYGNLTGNRIEAAVAQLKTYVTATDSAAGLLVYWDRSGKTFSFAPQPWPLIAVLHVIELAEIINEGRLTDYLIQIRNVAAHGLA